MGIHNIYMFPILTSIGCRTFSVGTEFYDILFPHTRKQYCFFAASSCTCWRTQKLCTENCWPSFDRALNQIEINGGVAIFSWINIFERVTRAFWICKYDAWYPIFCRVLWQTNKLNRQCVRGNTLKNCSSKIRWCLGRRLKKVSHWPRNWQLKPTSKRAFYLHAELHRHCFLKIYTIKHRSPIYISIQP